MLSSDEKHEHNCELMKVSHQPDGTTQYEVKGRDTLRSIAVNCGTTTSALMKLNKLSSMHIFPGQIIYLPQTKDDGDNEKIDSLSDSACNTEAVQDDYSFLAPLSPTCIKSTFKPFQDLMMVSSSDQAPPDKKDLKEDHVDEVPSGSSNTMAGIQQSVSSMMAGLLRTRLSSHTEDSEDSSKTQQPAQLERTQSYESNHSEAFEENFIKMTVHYITPASELVQGTLIVTPTTVMFDPDPTDPLVVENGCEKYGIMCNISDITSAAMYNDTTRLRTTSACSEESTTTKKSDNEITQLQECNKEDTNPSSETTRPGGDCPNAEADNSANGTHSTESNNVKQAESKLVYEFPLLHSLVKTVGEYLPLTGYSVEDKSTTTGTNKGKFMYLCVRSQNPMMKTFSLLSNLTQSPKKENKESKDKKEVKEGWFQVPRIRSDALLSFFMQWSPDNYTLDFAEQNGFIVADSFGDTEFPKKSDQISPYQELRIRSHTNSELEFVDDYFLDDKHFDKEWEIISSEEAKKRATMSAMEMANDDSSLIPEILDPCPLLNDDTLLALCKHLPARSVGYPWRLLYSTDEHGMSLRTLYRKMNHIDRDSSAVVLIKDGEQNIFGVFSPSRPRMSDHFYGNGESFLFKLEPEIEFYDWTGENNFFIKGNNNSLMFGGGDGTAGLWIDENVLRGRTRPCLTYNNALLSSKEDFFIQSLEVWGING